MNDITIIIASLRKEVQKLQNHHGKELSDFVTTLNLATEASGDFEDLWLGGWGQLNYNLYQDPTNPYKKITATKEYFLQLILNRTGTDLNKLEREIIKNLSAYKKFQNHLITELSIIRDNENFKNENEILNNIESFKWGFSASDYIQLRTPSQIPVYDLDILSKGIDTPPHITIVGFIISLTTICVAAKNFEDLIFRILRQAELKLGTSNDVEETMYSTKVLTEIFDNFHNFCSQVKNRHNKRSTIEIIDEYDVQDILHAILKLHFKDIREEEYTPSYAGSSTRMDFLLKNESIVIEVKKTRERLTDKEVGEQLILDVAHYKNHPNCKRLQCFVYDPESRIKNPRGLETDLSKLSDEKMSVELFIRP